MKRLIALLMLSTTCYAGTLDLPGFVSASYDHRLNNGNADSDNRVGRYIAYAEQDFSTKHLSKYIQGYVGYDLYDPNNDKPLNNYGIIGIHNSSLFNPLVLSLQYETPIVQSSDGANRFSFIVSYSKNWNLAK
jgi:hypothetical protein